MKTESDSKQLQNLLVDISARKVRDSKALSARLNDITNVTILSSSQLDATQKIFFLKSKHGSEWTPDVKARDGTVSYAGKNILSLKKQFAFIDFITKTGNNSWRLEGYISAGTSLDELRILIDVNGKQFRAQRVEQFHRQRKMGDILVDTGGGFSVDMSIQPGMKNTIRVILAYTEMSFEIPIKTGEFTRLAPLTGAYRQSGRWLVVKWPKSLAFKPYGRRRKVMYEFRFLTRLLFNWQIRHAVGRLVVLKSEGKLRLNSPVGLLSQILRSFAVVAEAIITIPRAYVLRTAYHFSRKPARPIWLVSDRPVAAGDNGEALFRYIQRLESCPAEVYFVISKKTAAYKQLRKIGNVLDPTSLKYKLLFLQADKIISSQADIPVFNPFVRQLNHFVDLYKFDFVFLQHGVIRHDLSKWLNRYNRNIKLFITTGKKEYQSILDNPYYYEKENVLLSGQPRYDLLENKPNRKLILSPTYRGNLLRFGSDNQGQRKYDPLFKKSEYRNFYNNFMNDPRITEALEREGMVGEYYLHPVFAAQRPDFDENDHFKIMSFPYDYKKAFKEGELLVSDHSSVVFDFVYLKKPTVYAHFDVDTFFNGHSYDKSDFFSDEKDGFGTVYYDYDSLVNGVVDMLSSGRKMSPKYQKRVDEFFYKVDRRNSERVYEAIVRLGIHEP
ncbi:CDP-glycerol glycerophosphotransferase family protein [Candidatus Saccharibacteria bacterium]|nr:CDP-glycerol glycerophosphotransferase family protein [Candidatus Saccharibacteria bacterium]